MTKCSNCLTYTLPECMERVEAWPLTVVCSPCFDSLTASFETAVDALGSRDYERYDGKILVRVHQLEGGWYEATPVTRDGRPAATRAVDRMPSGALVQLDLHGLGALAPYDHFTQTVMLSTWCRV